MPKYINTGSNIIENLQGDYMLVQREFNLSIHLPSQDFAGEHSSLLRLGKKVDSFFHRLNDARVLRASRALREIALIDPKAARHLAVHDYEISRQALYDLENEIFNFHKNDQRKPRRKN